MNIRLHFPIEPIPKQSARSRIVTKKDGKQFIQHYQTKEIERYEEDIRKMAIYQLGSGFKPLDCPIKVSRLTVAYKPLKGFNASEKEIISKGGWIFKYTKPDLNDNLLKPIFDALEGLVFTNDSRICEIDNLRKIYYKKPGIWITLKPIENVTFSK